MLGGKRTREDSVAPAATASLSTSLVSSAHAFSTMPVLTAFSWTRLPFCSLQLSGNMLPGLIPFPTPQGDPLLLGVVYSPLFSSVHSPRFILQKQAVRVPLCSVSESSTAWTPKSSCLQTPSLSRIPKPVCLLNSFLLPATTQILKRKHLGLLVWDFFYYWG